MKTFLTLFVLLFSSSVVAEDTIIIGDLDPLNTDPFNLFGKILICGKISAEDPDQMNINAFKFISDNKVLEYSYDQTQDEFYEWKMFYNASISKIEITFDMFKVNKIISRKDLNVFLYGDEQNAIIFEGKDCTVKSFSRSDTNIEQQLLNSFKEDLIYQATQDNKL